MLNPFLSEKNTKLWLGLYLFIQSIFYPIFHTPQGLPRWLGIGRMWACMCMYALYTINAGKSVSMLIFFIIHGQSIHLIIVSSWSTWPVGLFYDCSVHLYWISLRRRHWQTAALHLGCFLMVFYNFQCCNPLLFNNYMKPLGKEISLHLRLP